MDLGADHKYVSVGPIPDDWHVKELGFFLAKTPEYGINAPAVPYDPDLPTYIRITDISDDGHFSREDVVSVRHQNTDRYQLISGDLVLARTGASVGKSYLYTPNDGSLVFAGFLIRIAVDDQKLIPSYLAQYLRTAQYWNWVRLMSMRSGQPGINAQEYTELPIPVPPTLEEQRAITAALSDVDAMIEALDGLIAKKRDIKQGVMQELLTGKRRLSGFKEKNHYKRTEIGLIPDDWELLPFNSISSMHGRIGWQGLKQSEFTVNANDPFLITGMNFNDAGIRWEEVYHIPTSRYVEATQIQLRIGDVLMTKDGTIGKLLYIDHIPYPGQASLNSHLLVFRPLQQKYDPKFMFYQLASKWFQDHVELEKSGSTFFGITQEAVSKYKAIVPPIGEQQAIADILGDMDAEIAALEQKRDKTIALKQGMMQELLTGKTRLL